MRSLVGEMIDACAAPVSIGVICCAAVTRTTARRTIAVACAVRHAVNAMTRSVTAAQQMAPMLTGAAHASIISPTRLRTYGLRSALIFVLMIVGIGTGTFMLQEAASAVRLVIGAPEGGAVGGPSISARLNTPGGIAIAPNGDIYFADSNNDVIDRVDHKLGVTTFVGNRTNGFSGDNGPATRAQLRADVQVDAPRAERTVQLGSLRVASRAARAASASRPSSRSL